MKIICVGRNYFKHANELNRQIPTEPVIFLKPDSAILKKNKPFFLPDFSENVQYETEIVVKICKLGKSISAKFAHRYYDELTIGIDITARDLQNDYISKGLPWDDKKVPERKGIPATNWNTYLDDCTTREEVGTWVKSHYKW